MGQRERGRLPGAESHKALPAPRSSAALPRAAGVAQNASGDAQRCLGAFGGALGALWRMLSDFGGVFWGGALMDAWRNIGR